MILKHGFFKKFSSDRGTHFDNQLITSICTLLKIDKQHSSAYHPQSQGQPERYNKTFKTALRHYINDTLSNWSALVAPITFTYNSSKQTTTDFSPFFLLHGYEPDTDISANLPISEQNPLLDSIKKLTEIRSTIPDIIREAQLKEKIRYDKSHLPICFKPGDKVMVTRTRSTSKLEPLYTGPHTVISKESNLNI